MLRKTNFTGLVVFFAFVFSLGAAYAQAPDAGQVIGNQAAATYESGGQSFTVESNLVETTINPVFALSIVADQAKTTAPGNFVYFTHVITNNANTPDTISLSASDNTGDDFDFLAIDIFADANSDGLPDNLITISQTPSLNAGEVYSIVVRATVPPSAADTDQASLSVDAVSTGDASVTGSVTDTVTVSTGGIVSLQKDQTLQNDADGNGVFSEGDTVRVVITYENAGLSDALNVNLEDILPTTNADSEAITLTYVNNATFPALWSDSSTTLTDSADGNELTNGQGDSINYTQSGGTITAAIDAVPAGRVGTVTFYYTLTSIEEGNIENIATVTSTAQGTPENSNTSIVTIAATTQVVLADAEATSVGGPNVGDEGTTELDSTSTDSNTDDGTDEDDVVTEADDAFAGADVRFNMVLTNLSDITDSFVLGVANTAYDDGTAFPAGTTFQFVQTGTSTPIVSNTVVLTAGAVGTFDVVATFPTGASAVTGADFEATVTATSSEDNSVTNDGGINFTGDLLVGSVDQTDETGATGGVGANVTNGGAPWEAGSTDPGQTLVYNMRVSVPAGDPSNSFNLSAYSDAGFTTSLPAGWTVEFYDTSNNNITNTGTLTPTGVSAATFDFEVRITPPAGVAASGPTPQDVYVQALSPVNGVTDAIYYTVAVNEIVDVSIAANTAVQVAPGGVVAIPHTVTNNGNSTVTAGSVGFGADPFTDTGMTASIFLDDGNGVLDGSDTAITNISDINGGAGLTAGESATIFVRVQAPAGAAPGIIETGDVAIGTSLTTQFGSASDSVNANNTVADSVEVISGDLTLVKRQGVDAACDGVISGASDTALTQGAITADPGHCIVYEIVAANTGSQPATNVIITDATPSFTTLETSCATSCVPAADINGSTTVTISTSPADEGAGGISTDVAGVALSSGDTLTLTFTVQINQ